MKIVVTGAEGQVGRELARVPWPAGLSAEFFSRSALDITNPKAVEEKLTSATGLLINAAAYTAVDRAESEPEQAHAVNAEGPRLLARRCAALGIPMLHLSTDYVFDGGGRTPYCEADQAAPLNRYGASKLAGEAAVRASAPQHLILRTASVFSEFGQNFVKSMLRLGTERTTLAVVADQVSCPTGAADIARAIVRLAHAIANGLDAEAWGTYHFCGNPPVSWFAFAEAIFQAARSHGAATPALRSIRAAEYPSAAARPAYSALDCTKITRRFGLDAPLWASRLPAVVGALCPDGLTVGGHAAATPASHPKFIA